MFNLKEEQVAEVQFQEIIRDDAPDFILCTADVFNDSGFKREFEKYKNESLIREPMNTYNIDFFMRAGDNQTMRYIVIKS